MTEDARCRSMRVSVVQRGHLCCDEVAPSSKSASDFLYIITNCDTRRALGIYLLNITQAAALAGAALRAVHASHSAAPPPPSHTACDMHGYGHASGTGDNVHWREGQLACKRSGAVRVGERESGARDMRRNADLAPILCICLVASRAVRLLMEANERLLGDADGEGAVLHALVKPIKVI